MLIAAPVRPVRANARLLFGLGPDEHAQKKGAASLVVRNPAASLRADIPFVARMQVVMSFHDVLLSTQS